MNRIGQYLVSIVSAALLASICSALIEKNGAIGSTIKLITGIVLAFLVVSPWTDLKLEDPMSVYSHIDADATGIVQQGNQAALNEISTYIKEQMEAYILDKALVLDLDISVDVRLTEELPPSVSSVSICGSAAPYAKSQMKRLICEDLGVKEECLTWSQSNG